MSNIRLYFGENEGHKIMGSLKVWVDWQRAEHQGWSGGRALCNTGCYHTCGNDSFVSLMNSLVKQICHQGCLERILLLTPSQGSREKLSPLFPHTKNITKILVSKKKGLFPHHSPCCTELRTLVCGVKVNYSLGMLSLGVCKGIWEFTFSQAFTDVFQCDKWKAKQNALCLCHEVHKQRSLWSCPSRANKLQICEAHG